MEEKYGEKAHEKIRNIDMTYTQTALVRNHVYQGKISYPGIMPESIDTTGLDSEQSADLVDRWIIRALAENWEKPLSGMKPSGERFLNHRTEPEFLSGAFSLFPKICRASAFTTAIATAMMPEMNSVRTPVERKPSISFLTRQSMERYRPTPGQAGLCRA